MAFVACTDSGSDDVGGGNSNNDQNKVPEIALDASEVNFKTEGGSTAVTFTSSDAWTAETINNRADGWCSVSPTSGSAGNAKITITATANDTTDDRTATVVIKSGTTKKTISVSQKQKDALTVTSSKFEVSADGGEIEIEVKANIDFNVEIEESAKSWVTHRSTRAIKTSTLIMEVDENDGAEKRKANISISGNGLKETITIYQEGAKPTIVLSQNDYTIPSEGETITVEVKSNVDVMVEMPKDASWITENTTRGMSTNTYYFDIETNEEYSQRTAEIKFTNKTNNLSEVVKITQTQKDALVVAKDSYTVDSDGDQIEIEVGHNVNFDVAIDCDWITQEQTRAFTNETLTFYVDKNPTTDNREGTIIFKSKDGKLSQTVKVYQAQEDALIISKKDVVVNDESGTVSFEIQTNVEFKVSDPNVSWLRAVQTRGLTLHTLTYEYDANTSYDSREAKIVVTNIKTNQSETITITQAQKDAIVLAKDSYTVESKGGQIEIEVGHNVDFDVEIFSDWITLGQTRAFTTETLTFNVARNPNNDNREGTITFKSKDGNLSQTVKVYQAQEDALVISQKDIVVGDESGTVSFEIQTNVEFKVSVPNVSWLRAVQTRSLTSHTLIYEYDKNTSYDSRKAQIVVTDTKNNKSETITITQIQKDAIVIAEDNYSVKGEGGEINIEVGHNIEFDIKIDGDWITQKQTRTLETSNLIFVVAENTADKVREGSITFTSKNGSISQKISITQASKSTTNSQIWYTATAKVIPYIEDAFGATIISNEWDSTTGKGVITFDGEVTKIGDYAFGLCENLTWIDIPETITSIGASAFSGCRSLAEITIPASITAVGAEAFKSCPCKAYINCEIPKKGYGSGFFYGAGFTEVIIGDNVTTIGNYAFYKCSSLTSVTIGNGVTTIGNSAFEYCSSLTNATIGNGVTTIGNSAFYRCDKLTSITIPDSVTMIGGRAFCYCGNLESVTIPNSVTSIGDSAFSFCYSLRRVLCFATTPPTGGSDMFYNGNYGRIDIYVPADSIRAYKVAAGWSDYTGYIVGCDFESTTTINYTTTDGMITYVRLPVVSNTYNNGVGEVTFYGSGIIPADSFGGSNLSSITIPDSITAIGSYAFENCYRLTSVTIPNSVTLIGDAAFSNCGSLTSVTIPNSVTSIGDAAFGKCGSLTKFKGKFAADGGRCLIQDNTIIAYAEASGTKYTIPDRVTTIGNYAFYECDKLTSITIPDSVTMIGDRAFNGCKNLTSVTIPDNVTTIGIGAFYGCDRLTSITIPDNVTMIGDLAFCFCEYLTSVTIGDSVTTIGDSAFSSCHYLTKVYCKPTTPPILGGDPFNSSASGRKIYVPAASIDSYKNAAIWNSYADSIFADSTEN